MKKKLSMEKTNIEKTIHQKCHGQKRCYLCRPPGVSTVADGSHVRVRLAPFSPSLRTYAGGQRDGVRHVGLFKGAGEEVAPRPICVYGHILSSVCLVVKRHSRFLAIVRRTARGKHYYQ